MKVNGSPDLYYKEFGQNDNITSVVIPVNEEYLRIKRGSKPKKKVWIENETIDIKKKTMDSNYSGKTKNNILRLYDEIGTTVFGNSQIVKILGCSEVTATTYIKMHVLCMYIQTEALKTPLLPHYSGTRFCSSPVTRRGN